MSLQALIDADILQYEIGFRSQINTGDEIRPLPLEVVNEMYDRKVEEICSAVYATEPPILYFTGRGNFRDEVATHSVYKGNRKDKKRPFHFENIKAYAKATYDWREQDGLEADDLLSIEQNSRLSQRNTIICSRDKDLLIVPGYHYIWEAGLQPMFGPKWVEEIGFLQLKRGGKKLFGGGLRFFYAQCLMGDKTDNIPGLYKYGPVKTYNTLVKATTKGELQEAVLEAYRGFYGDKAEERLLEVGRQLWMTKELNEDGKPVLWEL